MKSISKKVDTPLNGYATLIVILNVLCSTFEAHSQNTSTLHKAREGVIFYDATLKIGGQKMTTKDTILVRGSFVLEPIKTHKSHGHTNLSTGITSNSEKDELDWYYLTDIDNKVGMQFNAKEVPTRNHIESYKLKNKIYGYGLSPEPFFTEKGYTIEDFIREKDTVINGQNCFIVKTNRIVPVINNGTKDKLLFIKMVINPSITGQNYSFISDKVAKQFGGAIVIVESKYGSGASGSLKLNYLIKLTAHHKAIFDKYEALYNANITLVKRKKGK